MGKKPTKKQLEAQRLRAQGLTYAEIGKRLGIGGQAVYKRLKSEDWL